MRSSVRNVAIALALAGCGVRGPVAAAQQDGGHDQTGLASWYGDEVAGNLTASGAPFDPDAITVAHRTLPLGSFVEVTALDTGRAIVAMVTDRGPGRADRVIDLSRGAARQLGIDRRPLSRVRIRAVVPSPEEAAALRGGDVPRLRMAGSPFAIPAATTPASRTGRYIVRIATFSSNARAEALAASLGAQVVPVGTLWRVVLGPFAAPAAAQRARDAAAVRGYGDAVILPQD